jgi:hypothetical protein
MKGPDRTTITLPTDEASVPIGWKAVTSASKRLGFVLRSAHRILVWLIS